MCKSYPFSELSEKVQKKVIEQEQQALGEDLDVDIITDFMRERLHNLGLPEKDIRWRLSYSQGDGVAFYGMIDLEAYLKANKKALGTEDHRSYKRLLDKDVRFEIQGANSRYHHWNSMRVELLYSGRLDGKIPMSAYALQGRLQNHVKDLSRELEKEGYEEIEYQTSETMARDHVVERRWHADGSECREESE